MISIRRRLVLMILGALALIFTIIALMNFYFTRSELIELMDGGLKQIAISVSAARYDGRDHVMDDARELEGDEDYLIRVWDKGALVYSSHSRINVPPQQKGYGDVVWRDNHIRYFQHVDKDRIVLVGQSFEERVDLQTDVLIPFKMTIFFLFPVVILVVYQVTGHGLKPLVVLSKKVSERDAQNLSPIDMTDVPREVLPLVYSLNQLFQRLEASLDLQRTFAADAAHELRTPLSAIKINLDLLGRTETEEERRVIEQNLEAGLERSIHLAQSLLLLARHEIDALDADMEKLDIAGLTEQIVGNMKAFAADKQQQISFKSTAPQSTQINAQSHNILVMIENLLQNAILYTPTKGHIEVEIAANKTEVTLSIADDGPGIEPEERMRVFDRFYRCQGNKQPGSGLGLSIIKNIVDYYQGKITIEDGIKGKGCRFVVTFPVT